MKNFSQNSAISTLCGIVGIERIFKRVWDSSQQAESARLSQEDTSKKVRAIKRAQGMAGEHLTKPPHKSRTAGLVLRLDIWGVVNLMEGYGNENPGANAHMA